MPNATIIGSGTNGLSAVIVLALAGIAVNVFEPERRLSGLDRCVPVSLRRGWYRSHALDWYSSFNGERFASLQQIMDGPRAR
jgi:protoporphyrinogen oxidase